MAEICPGCGGVHVTRWKTEFEGRRMTRQYRCDGCGRMWQEILVRELPRRLAK